MENEKKVVMLAGMIHAANKNFDNLMMAFTKVEVDKNQLQAKLDIALQALKGISFRHGVSDKVVMYSVLNAKIDLAITALKKVKEMK